MTDATEPKAQPPGPNPNGCGIFAAFAFFLIAALPALILAGMQGGACQGGPCHPDRVVSPGTALGWLAAAAVLVGVAVRALAARSGGRAPLWAAVLVAALLLLGWYVVIG